MDPSRVRLLLLLLLHVTVAHSLTSEWLAWLAIVILGRDLALTISAIYYRWISLPPPKTMARYWDFSIPSAEVKPTDISKVNTVLQLLLVGSAMALPVVPEPVTTAWSLREGVVGLQWVFSFSFSFVLLLLELTSERYLTAATTILSGLSYIFSKDAVKILSKEEVRARLAGKFGRKWGANRPTTATTKRMGWKRKYSVIACICSTRTLSLISLYVTVHIS